MDDEQDPRLADEIQEKRSKILKTIEQGSRLEQLYTQEDFQFFLGWIDSVRAELLSKVTKGYLLANIREQDHALGGYTYLTKVIEGAELFAKKGKKARKELEVFEAKVKENEEKYGQP